MSKELEENDVLRSFTRLNTATVYQVYSFKCDDTYTMSMAIEDYFNVRNFIKQALEPSSNDEVKEAIVDLESHIKYCDNVSEVGVVIFGSRLNILTSYISQLESKIEEYDKLTKDWLMDMPLKASDK